MERALRTSEELMHRALEITTVGIIVFHREGPVTYANKAFMDMSGYSPEDLQQERARWDLRIEKRP